MRLPWPFRRPAVVQRVADDAGPEPDGGAVGSLAGRPLALQAWRDVAPLQRTLESPPLTAPTEPFHHDLAGTHAPEPILGRLGHDRTVDGPSGLVSAVSSPAQLTVSRDVAHGRHLDLELHRSKVTAPAATTWADAAGAGEPGNARGAEAPATVDALPPVVSRSVPVTVSRIVEPVPGSLVRAPLLEPHPGSGTSHAGSLSAQRIAAGDTPPDVPMQPASTSSVPGSSTPTRFIQRTLAGPRRVRLGPPVTVQREAAPATEEPESPTPAASLQRSEAAASADPSPSPPSAAVPPTSGAPVPGAAPGPSPMLVSRIAEHAAPTLGALQPPLTLRGSRAAATSDTGPGIDAAVRPDLGPSPVVQRSASTGDASLIQRSPAPWAESLVPATASTASSVAPDSRPLALDRPTAAVQSSAIDPSVPALAPAASVLARQAIAPKLARGPAPIAPLASDRPLRTVPPLVSSSVRREAAVPLRRSSVEADAMPSSWSPGSGTSGAPARPLAIARDAVSIHRGEPATVGARSTDTRASTDGAAIHIPDEAGSLETGRGRGLVAHELAHVSQQRLGPSLPSPDSSSHDALESEARQAESWSLWSDLRLAPDASSSSSSSDPEPLGLAAPPTAAGTRSGRATPAATSTRPPDARGDATPTVQMAAGEAPPPAPAAGADASSGGSPMGEREVEELLRRLWPKVRHHLSSEFLVARERAGLLTDLR